MKELQEEEVHQLHQHHRHQRHTMLIHLEKKKDFNVNMLKKTDHHLVVDHDHHTKIEQNEDRDQGAVREE